MKTFGPFWCVHNFDNVVLFLGIGLRETIQKQLIDVGIYSDGLAGKMVTYMLDSKAGATNKKYFEYYKHFKSFRVSKGYPYKPAGSIDVEIYLTHLLDSKVSYHVISAVFYGLKWFQMICQILLYITV